ncbi:MAG: site-2 protease family protein, partial [Candidatus Poribacteria bacterium]|nr:site-2 protease family protein [Candidatus Poribacteria bacterium]
EKYNIITAWGKGFEKSWTTVSQVFSTLVDLIKRDISPRYLSGPIGIVYITARIAQVGFGKLLIFVGFISVNLGIVNLLPIPIADGGQILFFTLEKFRGKPLSVRKQVIIQQVSIVLLIGLFLYITGNDILRFFV